jgi:nucleoid-associated protein YgaU
MTDDAPDKRSQAGRRSPDGAAAPSGARRRRAAPKPPPDPAAAQSPEDDASLASLDRLQALASGTPDAAPRSEAARPAPLRTSSAAPGSPRPRTRPAAAPATGRVVARIAAPVVFLAAIIILLSITFQSGILGAADEPTVTPTPKVTKTKAGGNGASATTKKYIVKSGDTLSGIATKFGTSASELETLNPDMSTSTLVVGDRIIVPRQ